MIVNSVFHGSEINCVVYCPILEIWQKQNCTLHPFSECLSLQRGGKKAVSGSCRSPYCTILTVNLLVVWFTSLFSLFFFCPVDLSDILFKFLSSFKSVNLNLVYWVSRVLYWALFWMDKDFFFFCPLYPVIFRLQNKLFVWQFSIWMFLYSGFFWQGMRLCL